MLLLIVFFVSGCSLKELRHEVQPAENRAFSVEQAKEFFESDYTSLLTKSQDDDTRTGRFRGRMYPGDFTPRWDKAEYSESEGVAAYDVDILADRKVVAIRSKFGAGGAKAEKLNVYQKLVVRRDVESGKMAAYVMSVIPDIGCRDRRIPERFRSSGKDKGGFSGIVVYATTDRGALVRVQEYKDGVLKRGVYIPSGKGSYIDRCAKVKEILNGIALISRQCIRTKAGEDNWSDDYEDWYHPIEDNEWWVGNFTEVGFGVYTDGNGHYYLDNDENGIIDEETIAPGYVEDEEPESPLPEDNGNEDKNGSNNVSEEENTNEDEKENDEFQEGSGKESNEPAINSSIVSAQKMYAASQQSVNIITERYGNTQAACNKGVIIAFNQVFPDLQLPVVCANDLVIYWQQHSSNWIPITMQQAILYANEGYFVVAGWINNTGGSGHVAVIMPAETVKGTWNGVYTDVPQVMDTGYKRRESSVGINQCFGKDKHANVEFYKFVR